MNNTTNDAPEDSLTATTAAAPVTGVLHWLTAHRTAMIAIGAAAVLAIAAALVVTPIVQHQAADDAYQAQRILVTAQAATDRGDQAAFTVAAKQIDTLTPKVAQVHKLAAGYLPAPLISELKSELKRLQMYQGFIAGKPATPPVVTGTSTSTTAELHQFTDRLTAQAEENQARSEQTTKAAKAKTVTTISAEAVLAKIVTGVAASSGKKTGATTIEVHGLSTSAATLIASYSKADQWAKDAVVASAAAATGLVKKNQPVVDQVLDYLTKAAAVKTAHGTQEAAERAAAAAAAEQAAADAAARAGASTYTDPATGQSKSTPSSDSGGGGGGGSTGGASGGGSSSGGAPSAGSGGSGGSSPSRELRVRWGSKANGCPSGAVAGWDASASYGYSVDVHDNYLTAEFTDTGSGWYGSGTYCVY